MKRVEEIQLKMIVKFSQGFLVYISSVSLAQYLDCARYELLVINRNEISVAEGMAGRGLRCKVIPGMRLLQYYR